MNERAPRQISWGRLCVSLAIALSTACGGSASEQDGGRAGASSSGGFSVGGSGSSGFAGTTDTGGASGGSSGAGASSVTPHKELCSLFATCHDGHIRGELGNFCLEFTSECELGCRAQDYGHPYLGVEHDGDFALAAQLAREGLCNKSEGGAGGDDSSSAAGAPAFSEGGSAGN